MDNSKVVLKGEDAFSQITTSETKTGLLFKQRYLTSLRFRFMSNGFTTHIVIRLAYGAFLGVAILSSVLGVFIVAIPAFIIAILLIAFSVLEKKSLRVSDMKGVKQAQRAASYVVTKEGSDAMRNHLVQNPYDHKVALIYARTLSKHDLCDEGKRAYQLAAEGALKDDMQRAVEVFREYLAKYIKPFDHELTFQLSLISEQYGDAHFATQGLESIIQDEDVVTVMLAKSLKESVRLCEKLNFRDIAVMHKEMLEKLGQ